MNDKFSYQATLQGRNISLRPLFKSDFDELFSCASDKQIWAGHPHPTRYKLSEFRPYFQTAMDSKNCLVVTDNNSGNIIGSSRYYVSKTIPDDISIGFTFLVRKYWGGKTNLELKEIMLDYAFKHFNTVWFHVGAKNIRSQKATLKIGSIFSHEETLDISGKNESWFCYKIDKEKWLTLHNT
ncbi:MAG: RimJ/RimL family protein N-acetyltransferase [Cocleimonas sp.]